MLNPFPTYIYELTYYPLFILTNDFLIKERPKAYSALPLDFFDEYLKKATGLQISKQPFHMIYENQYFYILIPYEAVGYIWIGPILLNSHKNETTEQKNKFLISIKNKNIKNEIPELTIVQKNLIYVIQLVLYTLLSEEMTTEQLTNIFRKKMTEHTKINFVNIKSIKREISIERYSYTNECKLLHHIKNGNSVAARIEGTNLLGSRLGQLSDIKEKIPLYAFISLTSLISRTTIESGVGIEEAYALNDLYVQKADSIQNEKLTKLLIEMIVDFCLLVQQAKLNQYPKWINDSIEYINRHLHYPISLNDIASEVKMRPSYVSVYFKKITNEPLTVFIQRKRMEEAAFLLKNTQLTLLEISTLLSFSSQTYFATVFKKYYNVTPKNYRNVIIGGSVATERKVP